MIYIFYTKNNIEQKSQGFSDYWLAYKEAQLLQLNNNNISNIKIIEE